MLYYIPYAYTTYYTGVLDFDIQCTLRPGGKRVISCHKSLQLISTSNTPSDTLIDALILKWKNLPSSNDLSAMSQR